MSSIRTIQDVQKKEELIISEVSILGDVHEESIIDAYKLSILGTTHHDSIQYAKYATIYMHQGSLRCHEAKITLLDIGTVHATTVHVDTVIGGKIYAQDVTIKHLRGNATVYASNSITIEHISGKNNKLFINYKEVPILMSKLDLIKDDIQELNKSLEEAHRDNSSLEKEIEVEIQRLHQEMQNIQNSTINAKITIEKPVKTKNMITFEIDDSNIISFETQKSTYSSFFLSSEEDKITLQPTQQTIILQP